MANTSIAPEKITKPFQLMAAWFAMLVILVSVLLTAAGKITHPEWAAGYLVIFSSIVILIVIVCVILMLTKFRPNLQEGKEYAAWLKDQNTYSAGYVVKRETVTRVKQVQSKSIQGTKNLALENKDFLISVIDTTGSQALVESLKNIGLNAEVYQLPKLDRTKARTLETIDYNEGIWIGSRVAPKPAIAAIKLAATQWPELKYLHISTDGGDPPDYVHDQLFFGGSSDTAHSYGLREWSNAELLALNDEMSQQEFHSEIRKRYS